MQTLQSFLSYPEVQSGLIPFVCALIVAAAGRHLGQRLAGIGLVIALLPTLYFVDRFTFSPLTSTRKIILCFFVAAALGFFIDLFRLRFRGLAPVVAATSAAAILWVLWRIVERKTGMEFWIYALGSAAFCAWFGYFGAVLRDRTLAASAALAASGFGIGVAAVLGASGAYGQLGGAVAAVGGAYFLLAFLGRETRIGATGLLGGFVFASMIGIGAVVLSSLPWYSLAPIALVPLLAWLPLPTTWPAWMRGLGMIAPMFVVAGGCIYIAYVNQGSPMY